MDQMTKHRVHRYRVGRRHDDIHRFGAAGSRAISLHSCHAIHYMEPGLHKIVQIRRHLGKHFRRSEPGMGSTFVDTEDTAESVLDCPCYPFQLMSLHLTDIYHRVSVYYLITQHEAVSHSPVREFHLGTAFELPQRDAKIVSNSFDTTAFCHRSHFYHGIPW